jgi:hypothetical protein
VSACSWMSDFVVPFGVVPFANPVFEPIGTDDKLPACDRGPIFHPDKEGRLALATSSFFCDFTNRGGTSTCMDHRP